MRVGKRGGGRGVVKVRVTGEPGSRSGLNAVSLGLRLRAWVRGLGLGSGSAEGSGSGAASAPSWPCFCIANAIAVAGVSFLCPLSSRLQSAPCLINCRVCVQSA